MGFESTIDILDDDVNDTANFLTGESDLDSITDNNNNFTYDDGDMTGDDVTVDPKELLLDHDDGDDNNNNSNTIPLKVLFVRPRGFLLPKGIPTITITTTTKTTNKHRTPPFLFSYTPTLFFSSLPSKNNRLFRGIKRVCKRGRA